MVIIRQRSTSMLSQYKVLATKPSILNSIPQTSPYGRREKKTPVNCLKSFQMHAIAHARPPSPVPT